MDCNINEPLEENATGLHGMYTDFDAWVIRYKAFYRRYTQHPDENTDQKSENNSTQQRTTDKILTEDVFIADILLRQRHKAHTVTPPCVTSRENDGFMYFDHVLYRLMDKNGDTRILCRFLRSKL